MTSEAGGTVHSGPGVALHQDKMQIERMLEAWVLDHVRRGHPPSMDTLEKKAKTLMHSETVFSSEWMECLARRCSLKTTQDGLVQVQACSEDAVKQQVQDLVQDLVQEGNYSPQQVFVVGETGLWWGCLPKNKAKAGHRLTLLLCFNAAGNCRLQPLVMGHHTRPRALRDTRMSCLPVVWRANQRARVTSVVFDDWFVNHFVPAFQEHCCRNGLDKRGLLLVANTPGRPSHLLDHPIVKMAYLPSDTTPWPLGQGVADALGRHYLRLGIESVVEGQCGITLWNLWKKVDLKMALRNIGVCWSLMGKETLNRAWLDMWPGAVQHTSAAPEAPTQDIVALMEQRGLKGVSEVVLEALVWACQEEPSARMVQQVVSAPMCWEDQGLEEPMAGLLALTHWDLQDIVHLMKEACTLVEGKEGGRELCRQLKEASKEYKDLMVSREGLVGTHPPTLLPVKKEEVEVGDEVFTVECF